MAGAPRGHDQVVLRGSLEGDSFTLLLYRQGQFVGCECVNAAADFVAVRRALAAGVTIDPDLARDPDVRLKTLLCTLEQSAWPCATPDARPRAPRPARARRPRTARLGYRPLITQKTSSHHCPNAP